VSAAEHLPDRYSTLLPSRAYLLSWKSQTLPARHAALGDAASRFDRAAREATTSEDLRDMALLGVIGEALQPIEDVAYIGTAYESPLAGMAHYVTGTVYSATVPTTFYQSLRKGTAWPDSRLKVLAGLWVRNPAMGTEHSWIDVFESASRLSGPQRAAIAAAEDATVRLLRPHLESMAWAWERFSRYFHAFKHGGLFMSRQDFSLLDDEGHPRSPSIAVWRKDPEGKGHGDTTLTPSQVADQVLRAGNIALDVADYLVDSRLRSIETLDFADDGTVSEIGSVPEFSFWLHRQQIDPKHFGALATLGVQFSPFKSRGERGHRG
jgi:hypothetical protein